MYILLIFPAILVGLLLLKGYFPSIWPMWFHYSSIVTIILTFIIFAAIKFF